MKFLFLFSAIMILGCGEGKTPLAGKSDFQIRLNAAFKDASKSPLLEEDREGFRGLDFFDIDSSYVVTANLERTPNSAWFEMKTTTNRVSKERVYGIVSFELMGRQFKLNVYQGEEMLTKPGFEDYLFLPFIDDTNGESTYGGGRYIDLKIPIGDSILIDFNTAYNPYCAYNEKYSCPIVPRTNYLNFRINAGVKAYKKQ